MEVKLGYSMKFYCLVYVCMHACRDICMTIIQKLCFYQTHCLLPLQINPHFYSYSLLPLVACINRCSV